MLNYVIGPSENLFGLTRDNMEEVKIYNKLKRGRGKGQPLYEQIHRQLVKHIQTGEVQPGQRLPSTSQMVKNWKVDYQTVNLALQRMEKDGLIRCETGRGKGPVVISQPACKYSIMFLRWSNHGFPLEITEGVRKFAEEKGMAFTIADVSCSHSDLNNAIAHPVRGIDGIMVLPSDNPEFRRACLHAQSLGVKIVFVDVRLEGLPISSVSIDHVGGAHQATRHLLDLHGLPVYCMGLTPYISEQARMQGWAAAMREHDFHELETYIYETGHADTSQKSFMEISKKSNYQLALELLRERGQNGEKTCIFTCNGFAAQGVYKAAEDLGLEVGKQVYVAGFGDSPACWQLPVPLTSVAQRWPDLGYEAANLLFMEMTGAMQHPMYCLLPAKLRIRQSSTGNGSVQPNIYEEQKRTA